MSYFLKMWFFKDGGASFRWCFVVRALPFEEHVERTDAFVSRCAAELGSCVVGWSAEVAS